MEKCYIAGPITGTTDFKERFRDAEWVVFCMDMIPVNPVKLPHMHDKSWRAYMKECIVTLLGGDIMYMYLLKDWDKSAGAKIEYELAKASGVIIIYQ